MSGREGLTRRQWLARSGAAALAAPLAGWPGVGFVRAQGAGGIYRSKVGLIEITVLSDGFLRMPVSLLNRALPDAEIEAAVKADLKGPGQLEYSINVVLLKVGSEQILIDTGAGPNWQSTAGKLAGRIEGAGIDPAKITRVIVTHAHPDHIWGTIDEFDETPRFANADHVLPQAERDFWNEVSLSTLPQGAQGVGAGAKRVLKSLGDKLRTAKPEAEIAPGISYVSTPGHTPGHCSLRIAAGSETLLVTADTVFSPTASFAHPDWQPRNDMDGAKAAQSRKRLLDMAVAERATLLSYHLPFPGHGHVERAGGAYRWVAAG